MKTTLFVLITIGTSWFEQVKRLVLTDEFFKELNKKWDENKLDTELYQKRGGVFYYKKRILLSHDTPITRILITELHDSPWSGHSRYERTLQRLKNIVYWRGMKRAVRYIKESDICQRQMRIYILLGCCNLYQFLT